MQDKNFTLPKGTRDYDATQVFRREYIFDILRHTYQKYGFFPLETPAFEYLSTLTGKYGQEGDQLLFKILNSGDFLAGVDYKEHDYRQVLPHIAGKGLRYDLTVPLMRYVSMHRNQLIFPFRRYQIQPVWRADRPQKGRYREFYQCDIDVVGTTSLLCEAEILVMAHEVLHKLGIKDFDIQINHRGLLKGIAILLGEADKENALCVAIDKLDKVGKDKVFEELIHKGFAPAALEKLQSIVDLQGINETKLEVLISLLAHTKESLESLHALRKILTYVKILNLEDANITFNPTLARGLTYYTGTIFEVKMRHLTIGSIGGGGRYDQLTDIFGLPGMSGIGFSFGIERLYAVMEELDLFPQNTNNTTKVMLTNLDEESEKLALTVLTQLRANDIKAEIYPEPVKLKKQLNYAHKRAIPFVIMVNKEETLANVFTLKDMHAGTQQQYSLDQIVQNLL